MLAGQLVASMPIRNAGGRTDRHPARRLRDGERSRRTSTPSRMPEDAQLYLVGRQRARARDERIARSRRASKPSPPNSCKRDPGDAAFEFHTLQGRRGIGAFARLVLRRLGRRRRATTRSGVRTGVLGGHARLRDRPRDHPRLQLPGLRDHREDRAASRSALRRRATHLAGRARSRGRRIPARTTRSGCSREPSTTWRAACASTATNSNSTTASCASRTRSCSAPTRCSSSSRSPTGSPSSTTTATSRSR